MRVHHFSDFRDWSKSIGGRGQRGDGPGQRRDVSSVFEPLVRGGSYVFQLSMGVGHPVFFF